MKLKGSAIPGFEIDKKTGKLKRSTKRIAVSIRIARKKRPKVTYKRGNRCDL